MSDGENLEFDDFELPGDELAESADDATLGELDSVGESSEEFANLDDLPEGPELSGIGLDAPRTGEDAAGETVDEPQPADDAAVVVADDSPGDDATTPSKAKFKLDPPTLLAFGASGLLLAVLAYADLQVFGQWSLFGVAALNGIGLIAAVIPFLLWAGRDSLGLYTVLLSITLAAILAGCLLLLLELMAYKGDFKAKEKSLHGALPSAVQAAPPNTTTVA